MMKLEHRFVEYAPDILEDGVIYVSMECRAAIHKCACGCGQLVVTPFSPISWCLKFDGQTITLDPSIGNWQFDCKSHYWIINNEIKWAKKWGKERIEAAMAFQEKKRTAYYKKNKKGN